MKIKEYKRNRFQLKKILSWILAILIPVITVALLNLFLIKITFVNGISMSPTLKNGDTLLVWIYDYTPKQGDVVVIDQRSNHALKEDIVKRVIAVAGQTVRVDYNGNTVYVNEKPLRERYINTTDSDFMQSDLFGSKELTAVTVPQGFVFVLGDNRNHSKDSRDPDIGLIKTSDIIGKSVLTIPTDKIVNR